MHSFHKVLLPILMMAASAGQAASFHNSTGLAAPIATQSFNGITAGTTSVAGSLFSGVTFSSGVYVSDEMSGFFSNSTGGAILNFDPTGLQTYTGYTNPITLSFSSNLNAVGLLFGTATQNTSFAAYLGATLVESVSFNTTADDDYVADYYGFTGISFNKLVITGDNTGNNAFVLDNLQMGQTVTVSSVPEPGGVPLMLAGLGSLALLSRRRHLG